jgi:glyceraldehyde 3-phosphate dehydrogenase
MRVPVPDGSVCDLTFVSKKTSTVEDLQEAFKSAADGPLNGILRATDVPIVSTDIIGESCSSVVDLPLIAQVADNFFRVVAWYDNENAYSLRCVDLVEYMVSRA